MYGKIVVPLDGSSFAEHALPYASEIGARAGGVLDLVHVHMPVRLPAAGEVIGTRSRSVLARREDEARERERAYLEEAGRRLVAARGDVGLATHLLDGPVVPTLLDYRKSTEAHLIVMATHGRGPVARACLGGTADQIMRLAGVPVLLVRPDATPPELDREVTFRRILLALDGSRRAERALRCALGIAAPFGAAVTVVQAVPPADAGKAETAVDYLEGVVGKLRGHGVDARRSVVHHAKPAEAVLEASREMEADLVVLATHGRTDLPRLVLGSVADRLIRACPAPVLVCRARRDRPVDLPTEGLQDAATGT